MLAGRFFTPEPPQKPRAAKCCQRNTLHRQRGVNATNLWFSASGEPLTLVKFQGGDPHSGPQTAPWPELQAVTYRQSPASEGKPVHPHLTTELMVLLLHSLPANGVPSLPQRKRTLLQKLLPLPPSSPASPPILTSFPEKRWLQGSGPHPLSHPPLSIPANMHSSHPSLRTNNVNTFYQLCSSST